MVMATAGMSWVHNLGPLHACAYPVLTVILEEGPVPARYTGAKGTRDIQVTSLSSPRRLISQRIQCRGATTEQWASEVRGGLGVAGCGGEPPVFSPGYPTLQWGSAW